MVLSWMARSKRPQSVDDLVSRRRYQKAIDVMREEFAERYPSATERLRFADVLILAGREAEAVPVLLGVADEQERYGFREKALEALRRAEDIDPGNAEVAERLEMIENGPPEATTEEPEPEASDLGNLEAAIDGAFAASTEPPASLEVEEDAADTGIDPGLLEPLGDATAAREEPTAPEAPDGLELDEDELLLSEEDLEPFDPEEDLQADARALIDARHARLETVERSLLTEDELEAEISHDAQALLSGKGPEPGEYRPLLTEEEIEDDIQADARALLGDRSADTDEYRPLITEEELEAELQADARALLATADPAEIQAGDESELHEFVQVLGQWPGSGRSALGSALFAALSREELRRVAAGLHPRCYSPGDLIVREGDPGASIFLIASGSVRILVTGGRDQPFEIRQIDAGDFFGEVAALSGDGPGPRRWWRPPPARLSRSTGGRPRHPGGPAPRRHAPSSTMPA